MRRQLVLPFVVITTLLGCGGSDPSLGGLDVNAGPDAAIDEDTRPSLDADPRDPTTADESAGEVTPVEVWLPDTAGTDEAPVDAPDAALDAPREEAPDVPPVTLPYPLCQPCRSDLECETAEIKAPCLVDGPDGRTCGFPCAVDGDCPEGFACLRDDVNGRQCRPMGGATCPCLPRFVAAGFKTVCYRENDLGRCEGLRTCDQACPVSEPTPEICNGRDDNCDGKTDEGLESVTCGKGTCAVTRPACIDGTPAECVPRDPTTEICDGLDNDCDGQTDQGLGVLHCGTGVCAVSVDACIGGRPQPCWPTPPGAETCNGLDDDCDGEADEGFGETTCGVGACLRTVANCADGTPVQCIPGDPAPDEVCNRIDDDCDGQIDEGLGSVTCGVGACARTVTTCDDGSSTGDACVPGDPAAETCDGLDNDCNGTTDDGLGTLTCGLGACATSTAACINGRPQICQPPAPGTESCNGRDDDCDGATDESDCPCMVTSFGGHMYQFCTARESWDTARKKCAADDSGYHLVVIETEAESRFVIDTAWGADHNQWWLGLNDLDAEGKYVWVTGAAPAYLPWTSGQPNNGGGGLNPQQDCVEVLSNDALEYGWNDATCWNRNRYVCEYP